MYDWLPPWFKKGNSFFGVRKEVKDRLNKQMRRGVSAQLKQLEEDSWRRAFTRMIQNGTKSSRQYTAAFLEQ